MGLVRKRLNLKGRSGSRYGQRKILMTGDTLEAFTDNDKVSK
jgi:hypothetical protein